MPIGRSDNRNMRATRAWSSTKPLKARAQTSNRLSESSSPTEIRRPTTAQQPNGTSTPTNPRAQNETTQPLVEASNPRNFQQSARPYAPGRQDGIGRSQVGNSGGDKGPRTREKTNRHTDGARMGRRRAREGSGQMTDECRYVTWPHSWDPATSENQTTTGQTAPKCEKTPPQTNASDPREPASDTSHGQTDVRQHKKNGCAKDASDNCDPVGRQQHTRAKLEQSPHTTTAARPIKTTTMRHQAHPTAGGSNKATRVPASGTAAHTLLCRETASASEGEVAHKATARQTEGDQSCGVHANKREKQPSPRKQGAHKHRRSTVWERMRGRGTGTEDECRYVQSWPQGSGQQANIKLHHAATRENTAADRRIRAARATANDTSHGVFGRVGQHKNGWAKDASGCSHNRILRNMRATRAWSSTKPLKARAQSSNHDPAGSARAAAQRRSAQQPNGTSTRPTNPRAQARLLNRWWKYQSHESSSKRHGPCAAGRQDGIGRSQVGNSGGDTSCGVYATNIGPRTREKTTATTDTDGAQCGSE